MGKTVVEFDKESRRQLAKTIYTESRRLRVDSEEGPNLTAHFLEIIAYFCKIIARAIGRTIGDYSLERK